MTILAFPTPYTPFKGFTNDGSPLAGGLLYSYAAGTNTPLVTYQDPGMASPNANPTVLNARGEAPVFTPPNVAYKFLLTDSLGNTIPGWPIDNLILSQLITLYGGVDIGSTNAYILNFTSNFTSLTDGIVLFWIPSHTNTGASTLNVNGLGAVNIVNANGTTVLTSGEITANQPATVLYQGGNWLLISATTLLYGFFTPIWTGFSTPPTTGQVLWRKNGNLVTLIIPQALQTSNAVTMTMTGMPSDIIPGVGAATYVSCLGLEDNGALVAGGMALVGNTGIVSFYKDGALTVWTNSGTKGVAAIQTQLIYTI